MPQKKLIITIVGVVILIGLIWLGVYLWSLNNNNPNGASPYAAVYFTNGTVYFGKLSWYPEPHLTNVWSFTQNTTAQGQSGGFSLAPFKNTSWDPVDEIYFNNSQVLFWTYLRNDSSLVKAFQ